MAQSVDRRRRGYCKESELWTRQVAFWVLIFSPPPLSPSLARWQGSSPEDSPFFCWGFPPRRKGFREVAWALDLLGPQPSGQSKDIQELFLVFISIVFLASCSERPVLKITPSSPLLPQSPDVWAMILLMYVQVFLKLCNLSSVNGQEP